MATKGQVLTNPHTRDIFEFIETSADTSGERVTIKMTLNSRGQLVPEHLHTLQEEHYEVLSGTFTGVYEGQSRELRKGESITLPVNKPHNHFNNSDEPAVIIQTVSPALDFEYFIESLIGLASDGKMPNGKAGLMQELVTLKYIDSKAFLASIPLGLQKVLMNVLGPIGRLVGYRAIYKKYTSIEK
jgi:quercetin dioxygenase-like cupin family protein